MATDHAIISCSRFVIIELNRFCTKEGLPEKNFDLVNCFPEPLVIPVQVDGEVAIRKRFQLVASINHEGTLISGHYWALIKDPISSSWLRCNDRAVDTNRNQKIKQPFLVYSVFLKQSTNYCII